VKSEPPAAPAGASPGDRAEQVQDGAPRTDGATTVELELPARRPFHPTGRLVAGGVASRLQLDVDRMNDVRLAVDALLLQPPAEATVRMRMTESAVGFSLEVGPFSSQGADLAGLTRILRALVDEFAVYESEAGEWIAVRLSRSCETMPAAGFVEPMPGRRGGR
jgi:hypothetical protein